MNRVRRLLVGALVSALAAPGAAAQSTPPAKAADTAGGFSMPLPLAPADPQRPHYDPRSGDSPLMLTKAPADGVAYHALRSRVRNLYDAKAYDEALPLAEQLVRDYPRDGQNWMMLARTRLQLSKHAEAAAAYERAGALLGWSSPGNPVGNAASQHLAAGNRTRALELLREEQFHRMTSPQTNFLGSQGLAALREDPQFLEIVRRPRVDPGLSRDAQWRYDLDFLLAELRRLNPTYRQGAFPPAFVRAAEQLHREIPQLSTEEIFVRMGRLIAVLHQGHNALFFPGARLLPFRFYVFPDGIYIVEAAAPYGELAGTRVQAIGTMTAEEVLRRIAAAMSADGDNQFLWLASELASTAYLKGVGAIDSVHEVRVTVRRGDGSIATVPVQTTTETPAVRLDRLVAPPNVTPPRFLRDRQAHWEEALPEQSALYIQMNNVVNDADETLPAFGHRIWSVIQEKQPRNVILDLRNNNGGNTYLYREFLRTMIAFSRTPHSQLYILIGRRTYSAAGNLITDLERLADPIFVGEPSSECCNLYGDPAPLRLPYSGIGGELSAVKWNLSQFLFDARREITPHVPVQLTAADYFAGRDPVMDAVLRLIQGAHAARGQ
jgi:hypothetical protein